MRVTTLICIAVAVFSAMVPLASGAKTIYVAEKGNDVTGDGSESAPFFSVSRGLTAATEDSDTVSIATGTYTNGTSLSINRPIHVVGAGPDTTLLSPVGETNTFLTIAHSGAVVSGLRVCNYGLGSGNGAVYITAGRMEDCCISNNAVGGSTPAVHLNGSEATLAASVVCNNSSYGKNSHVAGLKLVSGLVTNCIITGNTAGTDASSTINAAGVYQTGGLLYDSRISANSAVLQGNGGVGGAAGILITGGTLERCIISSNINGYASANAGSGLFAKGGTIRNCLIVHNRNTAYTGTSCAPGITTSGNPVIEHVTVYNNFCERGVLNGVYLNGGTLRNAIVHGNGPADQQDLSVASGTVQNCLFKESDGTNGNLAGVPVFMDADNDDFHLAFGSPGIDAGATTTVTNDMDGIARPFDGDGNGTAAPDMGCYEIGLPADTTLVCGFALEATEFRTNDTIRCTPYALGGTLESCIWHMTQGAVTTTVESAGSDVCAIRAPGYGEYALFLKASVTGGAVATSAVRRIRVLPGTVYVASGGSSEWPYDTPAKATLSLTDAIDAVCCGDTDPRGIVSVAGETLTTLVPTTYSDLLGDSDYLAVVTRPVRIVGADPASTILRCRAVNTSRASGIRLVHAEASIENLTVQGTSACGCATATALGGLLTLVSGTASNCVFTGNQGGTVKNYRCAVYLLGGRLRDCDIVDNSVGSYNTPGIQASGIVLANGEVMGCRIGRNTATGGGQAGTDAVGVKQTGGTLRNSVIFGNTSSTAQSTGVAGLYLTGGTSENCIVSNNAYTGTAASSGGGVNVRSGRMRNGLVLANQTASASGAAVGVTVAGGIAENLTVYGNTASASTYDGLLASSGTIRNCIAYGNGSADTDNLTVAGDASVTYCCFPAADGTGYNQSGAPFFKNAAQGDFSLLVASVSCVNKGVNADWTRNDTDLAGNCRLVNGRVDIGCYEVRDNGTRLLVR